MELKKRFTALTDLFLIFFGLLSLYETFLTPQEDINIKIIRM